MRVNAKSRKPRASESLSTGLYPWPGTGVLKVCFANLLGACEINATGIFNQVCSQVVFEVN